MPKYRPKSGEELAWNTIRRAATAKVQLEAAAWKEKRLNDILPELQQQFQRMMSAGNLPELEADYEKWVEDAFAAAQRPQLRQ